MKERVVDASYDPVGVARPQDPAPQEGDRRGGCRQGIVSAAVPRFLSSDWVTAFNEALADADLGSEATRGSLVAADGRLRVTQLVSDVPPDGGTLATTLIVEDGRLRLERHEAEATTVELVPAHVTITLGYADAAAMSRGELSPAEALGTGRVRVRGDLAVLMASQLLLAALADHLEALAAATTY